MFSVEQKVLGERKELFEKVGIFQEGKANPSLQKKKKKLHRAKGKR